MSDYNKRESVFKRFYEDLGRKRDLIEDVQLGETYTRVLDEYNHCMEVEEYIVSFLLIQNLLEDRVYVLYKYVYEFKKKHAIKFLEEGSKLKAFVTIVVDGIMELPSTN